MPISIIAYDCTFDLFYRNDDKKNTKIRAIKAVHHFLSCSLKDAKDLIEKFRPIYEFNDHPEKMRLRLSPNQFARLNFMLVWSKDTNEHSTRACFDSTMALCHVHPIHQEEEQFITVLECR